MEFDPKKEIAELKDGESWIWPEGDYGKAEVWFKHGTYFLFSIPLYGGKPAYESAYGSIHFLVETVNSWT